jgi:hypothetical protein
MLKPILIGSWARTSDQGTEAAVAMAVAASAAPCSTDRLVVLLVVFLVILLTSLCRRRSAGCVPI